METEILLENRELFEQRPDCWEFILTVDRLELPLEEIIREAGAVIPAPASANASELASAELLQKNSGVIRIAMEALGSLMEARLAESWGAPGQPGSVAGIERVCGEILSRCRELAGAEREILTTPMHPQLADAQAKYQGLAAENIFRVLEVIKSIRIFIVAGGTGELNLNLRLTTERLAGIVIPNLISVERTVRSQFQTSSPSPPAVTPMTDTSPASGGGLESLNMFFGYGFLFLGMFFICLYWPFAMVCLLLSFLFFASAGASV
ncbi:MAG: hypothetical protein ACOYM3_04570 [Terrimicrobiaceae bacterium]